MKFQIEDVIVYFPYESIYPEQYAYMMELKQAMDAKGQIEDVTVYFPYESIYPEQYAYMMELKQALDAKGQIEDVTVYFPYESIYPEQYAYMMELKQALDAKGHCLLEMPTSIGKTIALLSLITSYSFSKPFCPLKLLYCTRTVHEMEKTLAELKLLYSYQSCHLGPAASNPGLSSRKNLCVNPRVLADENRHSVDAGCRKLTASWVWALDTENPGVPTCELYENYDWAGSGTMLPRELDKKVKG